MKTIPLLWKDKKQKTIIYTITYYPDVGEYMVAGEETEWELMVFLKINCNLQAMCVCVCV